MNAQGVPQFHDRLREGLRIVGHSQTEIANRCALSITEVNRIVTGRIRNPRFSTVVKIAVAADLSLDWLAGFNSVSAIQKWSSPVALQEWPA